MLIIGLLAACGEPPTPTQQAAAAQSMPAPLPTSVSAPLPAPVPIPDSSRLDRHGQQQLAVVGEHLRMLAASTSTASAQTAAVYGEAGQDYQAYGFDQAAGICYANAALLDPSDWRWPYLSAVLSARGGDSTAALSGFERAADLLGRAASPDPLQARAIRWRLGEAALHSGDSDTAAGHFRLITEQAPKAVAAWLSLGRAELAADRPKAALSALRRADRLAPRQAVIRYQMGRAWRALGERERAAPLLAAAANGNAGIAIRDPLLASIPARAHSPTALRQRAAHAYSQQRFPQSAQLYREALKLDPDSAVAHLNLAGSLIKLHQPRLARQQLQAALRLDPQLGAAHRGLAGLDKRQGDNAAALRHLLAAEALTPNDTGTLADLGHLLAAQGDATGAARRFDTLLKIEPTNERGLLGQARVLDLQQRRHQALAALVTAAALRPDSPTIARALESYRSQVTTATSTD